MPEAMLEDTSKFARLRKMAAVREHLEHLPPGAMLNTGMAAIYLGVSTKSLARWRQVKNMGPAFQKQVVAEGAATTTQPYKYRKQDLDSFVGSRMSLGGFDFASAVEPWSVGPGGAIEGSALGLPIEQLLETDPLVASLLDALAEPWANAEVMRPYRDEIAGDFQRALEQFDSSLLNLQLEEDTAMPGGKPTRRGL